MIVWSPLHASGLLARRKRPVLECQMDSVRIRGYGGLGLALRLGLSLAAVPPRLYLEGGGMVVECVLLADLTPGDRVFVEERLVERLSSVPQWSGRRFPPPTEDASGWTLVLLSFKRGCVAEALLQASLSRVWEDVVAEALRGNMVRQGCEGVLVGTGLQEAFSLECGGKEGQVTGRVTDATEIRIQRRRGGDGDGGGAAVATCAPLTDLCSKRQEGIMLIEAGGMSVAEMESAVDACVKSGNIIAHHVSAAEVARGQAKSLFAGHVSVLWHLDEVCNADDDPDEAGRILRMFRVWLTARPATGCRLVAVVRNAVRLAGSIRALFPAVVRMCRSAQSNVDSALLKQQLKLALQGFVGSEDATLAIEELLLGEGSVMLVGPSGTGKSMLCDACCKCTPHVRGTLGSLVQCFIGESERALVNLFAGARQSGALVVLDDVDALLLGPTGRGLELQLARELQRGGCRVILTCRTLDSALAALVRHVVQLRQPDESARRQLIAVTCSDAALTEELVAKTDQFSQAECVRLGRLAKLQCLAAGDTALSRAHYELALEMLGPFSGY